MNWMKAIAICFMLLSTLVRISACVPLSPEKNLPEVRDQFTLKVKDSLKVVTWGCTKGTKCYITRKIFQRISEANATDSKPRTNKSSQGKHSKNDGKRNKNSPYLKWWSRTYSKNLMSNN